MTFIDIDWKENGWTLLQEADSKKHILEITCKAEDGVVVEIRKRHNDGEEEKITAAIDENHSLPMPLKDFKKAYKKKEINW